jgi:outer membrane protein assembly factor BamD
MRLVSLLLATLLLASCATTSTDPTEGWSAAKLYSEAKDNLNQSNYEQAINYFETLEARYPFGRYAQQAQLEIAYAYYKYDEPDSAIAAADRFIKLNPRHPHVDYAYYLKGLVNFSRGRSFMDRFIPKDPSDMDPKPLNQSFADFSTLVQRFPNSRYAPDARQRMIFLRNELAEYELKVADYYVRRGAWLAVAKRSQYVLENYPGAPVTPDALALLTRAYKELGMTDLERDTRRILELNYPEFAAERGK